MVSIFLLWVNPGSSFSYQAVEMELVCDQRKCENNVFTEKKT